MAEPGTGIPGVTIRRPHRADARRNYDALLEAARTAFAEEGIHASLDEIAKSAGVGIGTLYRNFAKREDLFHAVYVAELEELYQTAAEAAELEPWPGLVAWLRRFARFVVIKRAIYDALDHDSETFRAYREAMQSVIAPLLEPAQASGDVRADMSFDDFVRIMTSITSGRFDDDDQRERVFQIALDGIRAAAPVDVVED